MPGSNGSAKIKKLLKQRIDDIRIPSEHKGALEDRPWLEKLYLRLIPFVYDYPELPLEQLLQTIPLHLTQAEQQYLLNRLTRVRKKKDVAVVSRNEEDVLLPVLPNFDPRRVPLVACWSDGGFYNLNERKPGKQNERKLRGLGLVDGVTAYASFRALILSPQIGHPSWKEGPFDTGNVVSSYEAEVKAAEVAISAIICRLEKERGLPAVDCFHLVLYTDCQSLAHAVAAPPSPDESFLMGSVRTLAANFAALHPIWQPRREIKQRLGH